MSAKKPSSEDTKSKAPRKANGEGSAVKIKEGKWKVTITIGRDENGKQQRKVFYGKSRIEALENAQQYKLDGKAGLLPSDETITLQQWVKIWIFEYKSNELRDSSLSRYEGIYRNYIKNSNLGKTKLAELKPAHLQSYYNSLIRTKGSTPDTVKSINKVVKAALSQAVVEKFIIVNPCNHITLPKLGPKEEIQPFTVEEQRQFIAATEGHRHRALFLLDLGTGLRIGELLGLKWSDIDLKNMELSINETLRREVKIDVAAGGKVEGLKTEFKKGQPKTKFSKRTVPIPSNLIKELKLHQIMQNGEKLKAGELYVNNNLVFPNELGEPTDARNLTRSYERLLARYGIPYRKFHTIRHTFATRLFEKDVDLKTVSILLGHSDIKITADIYTHVMPNKKIDAVEKLNDLFVL